MTVLYALLGSAGFLSVVGVVIQQFFGRGKNRVDVAAGIINASSEVMEQVRAAREQDLHEYRDDLKAREHIDEVILDSVPPLLAWIDGGAPPPPPQITDELRGMLAMLVFLRAQRARDEAQRGQHTHD